MHLISNEISVAYHVFKEDYVKYMIKIMDKDDLTFKICL